MRPLLVSILICLGTAVSTPASASPDDATTTTTTETHTPWTLQVDPLTTALGYVHLQVERVVNPRLSIYAGPHLRLFKGLLSDDDEDFLGLGVEVGVRYFWRGDAPRGPWAQVRGVAARLSTDATDDDPTLGGYGSVLAGYTFILGPRWVVSLGIGVQYIHYSIGDVGPEGVLPAAHTAVGLAF